MRPPRRGRRCLWQGRTRVSLPAPQRRTRRAASDIRQAGRPRRPVKPSHGDLDIGARDQSVLGVDASIGRAPVPRLAAKIVTAANANAPRVAGCAVKTRSASCSDATAASAVGEAARHRRRDRRPTRPAQCVRRRRARASSAHSHSVDEGWKVVAIVEQQRRCRRLLRTWKRAMARRNRHP